MKHSSIMKTVTQSEFEEPKNVPEELDVNAILNRERTNAKQNYSNMVPSK